MNDDKHDEAFKILAADLGKIVEDALNKAVAENPQAAQYSRRVHNAILVAIPGMIGTALAYWRIRAQEEAEDAA